MKTSFNTLLVTPLIALVLAGFVLLPVAEAQRGGGGGGRGGGGGGRQDVQAADSKRGGGSGKQNVQVDNSKSDARTNNVRSTSSSNVNANRNTNVNANRNTDVNVDVDRGGWDNDHHHPAAGAAAVTATAVAVGSIVRSVPPSCVPVNYNNVVYQQCGSTWYQPQYVGSQVQYVVVNPPR
jgi:hypothetical protein